MALGATDHGLYNKLVTSKRKALGKTLTPVQLPLSAEAYVRGCCLVLVCLEQANDFHTPIIRPIEHPKK